MQSRVKKEPKVVYEETTETYEDVPRPPRGGKRGRQPVPMPQHDSEPLSSDSRLVNDPWLNFKKKNCII